MSLSAADERILWWDGLLNGRDLAGIPVAGSTAPSGGRRRVIAPGRLIRSGSTHLLTSSGWKSLVGHGVGTIVDIRSEQEAADAMPPPGLQPTSVRTVSRSIEPPGFIDSWVDRPDRWKLATPHYYDEFMSSYPQRVGVVIDAVAAAPPGGVLVHCSAGRDRAGLTVAMILDLIGVDHREIIADHWLSFDRSEPIEVSLGKPTHPGAAMTRHEHQQVLSEFLGRWPAQSCFSSDAAAAETKQRLLDRLVA